MKNVTEILSQLQFKKVAIKFEREKFTISMINIAISILN